MKPAEHDIQNIKPHDNSKMDHVADPGYDAIDNTCPSERLRSIYLVSSLGPAAPSVITSIVTTRQIYSCILCDTPTPAVITHRTSLSTSQPSQASRFQSQPPSTKRTKSDIKFKQYTCFTDDNILRPWTLK